MPSYDKKKKVDPAGAHQNTTHTKPPLAGSQGKQNLTENCNNPAETCLVFLLYKAVVITIFSKQKGHRVFEKRKCETEFRKNSDSDFYSNIRPLHQKKKSIGFSI